MMSPLALRRRLGNLGQLAIEALLPAEPAPPAAPAPELARDPVEHLRCALAASRAADATSPDPKIYGQLRLWLNQLESGRISSEPTRELTRRLAPEVNPRPRLSALLRRKAHAAVRRVARFRS